MGESLPREEVHNALESLYDNVALAGSTLLQRFPQIITIARLDERADKARAMLLEAIEVLRPVRSVPFGSPESRSYDLLTLRYVENLPLPQVMRELSLSRRQVYRDLAEAEEKLAQVLVSWMRAPDSGLPEGMRNSLSDELSGLASQPGRLQLTSLVQEAVELVVPLADRLQVRLSLDAAAGEEALVLADRSLVKQVLVQAISAAVQSSPIGEVRLSTQAVGNLCTFTVVFQPAAGVLRRDILDNAFRLAASQGIVCDLHEHGANAVEVQVHLRRGEPVSVLVVEDNAGAVDLYRRFLSGGNWQVTALANPRLACEVAKRTRPDVIILDIIMPGIDGWSIIKALQQTAETATIPLLICSVLEDPRLAEALGASVYLKKPVSRAELVSALHHCLGRRLSRGG